MPSFWRIRSFQRHFFVAQNKKMRDPTRATWMPIPISYTGRGYCNLMARPDGMALYGAFILIAQTAARCPKPGDLISDGVPITPEDIARVTRADKNTIEQAFKVLSSSEIRWIEEVAESTALPPQSTALPPQSTAVEVQDRTGQGQDRTGEAPPPQPQILFPADGIPSLVASELRNICPSLRDLATPMAISQGPFLTSRFREMPLPEWMQAVQEFAGFVNGGGEYKAGKTWLTTLTSFIANRHTAWTRDLAFADRTATRDAAYPSKNNPAAAGGSHDPLANAYTGT